MQLSLVISDTAADGEAEREQATLALLEELRDQGAPFDIRSTPSAPVRGAKDAPVAFGAGQLVLTLASSGALAAIVGAVQNWLLRNNSKEVILEMDGQKITLKGPQDEEVRKLVNAFVRRKTH